MPHCVFCCLLCIEHLKMFHHRFVTTRCLMDEVFSSWKQRRLRVSEWSAHIEKVLDLATTHNRSTFILFVLAFGIVWNAICILYVVLRVQASQTQTRLIQLKKSNIIAHERLLQEPFNFEGPLTNYSPDDTSEQADYLTSSSWELDVKRIDFTSGSWEPPVKSFGPPIMQIWPLLRVQLSLAF